MPVMEQYEAEAPMSDELMDREELARLAYWHWEMRGSPDGSPEDDWYWAEDELRRLRLAAGADPEAI